MPSTGYTFDAKDFWTEWDTQVMLVTGLGGFPKRKEPTEYDWQDEDGVQAFTDEDDIKFEARDITLKCYIKETTEDRFWTKLSAIRSSMCATGLHDLKVKHAFNIFRVYYKSGSALEMLTRWNTANNVGEFYLPFREPNPTYPAIWKGLIGRWDLDSTSETLSAELMPNAVERAFGGASAWENVDLSTYNETGDLTIMSSATSQYCKCPTTSAPTTSGKTYKLGYDLSSLTATWTIKSNDGTDVLAQATTVGTGQTAYFKAGTTGGYRIVADATSTKGNFDNFTLKSVSCDDETTQGSNGVLYGFDSSPYGANRVSTANGAISFAGTDDYIDTASTFQSTFRKSFSISFWVKPTDGQPASTQAFCGAQEASATDQFSIELQTNGKIKVYFIIDSQTAHAQSNAAVFANGTETWHHIAVVGDYTRHGENGITLYVDGAKVTLDASSDGNTTYTPFENYTNTKTLYLGALNANGTANYFFIGSMSEFRIYKRILSYEEIKVLYHTKPDGTLDI